MDATMSMDTDGMDDRVAAGRGAWLFFFLKGQREKGKGGGQQKNRWQLGSQLNWDRPAADQGQLFVLFEPCRSLTFSETRLLPEFLGFPSSASDDDGQ
jgi:hypothetical protein